MAALSALPAVNIAIAVAAVIASPVFGTRFRPNPMRSHPRGAGSPIFKKEVKDDVDDGNCAD